MKILLFILIFINITYAFESKCDLSINIPMLLNVEKNFISVKNYDSKKVITIYKYLYKTSEGFFVYGEGEPDDFFVKIYLGKINDQGEFDYYRVSDYGKNDIQWWGRCKIVK